MINNGGSVGINSLQYACRMDICCKGDGSGCNKVIWNYNTNGTRSLASGYTCSSANGDVLLSEEFKNINNNQYISKCLQYGARINSRWQENTGEDLGVDYPNLIKPYAPYKGEDCYFDAYGVCCKLDLTSPDAITCAGSRTSRTWCFNKNSGTNQHRWLSSKYECSNVFVKTPNDTSPVQINLGKYDCDICEKLNIIDTPAQNKDLVKEEKYFYPGYFKDGSGITRDRNPGTLPGSVVMHSCNNCLESTIDYPVYRDYFKNLPGGTPQSNKFAGSNNAYYSNLQYYSDKDTFRQTLNPNNTTSFNEEQCCTTPSDQYQVRSNFLSPSTTATQVIPCTVCSNPTCTCNYGNPTTCPTFDFSDCEDGSSQDPFGRCCINGSCSIKVKRDCEQQGGLWGGANTNCTSIPGGAPCDLGACCNGDVDTGGTCTNNVIRANCSVADFKQGKQCGVIENGILTCASEPRVTCCYSNYNGSSTGTCLPNIRQSLCTSNSCDTSNGTLPKGTAACDPSLCSDMDIGKCCTSGTCAVKTRKCCVDGSGTFTQGGDCSGSNPCNVSQLGRCCYRTAGNPSRCRPCTGNEQEINPVGSCCSCLDGKTKAECDALVGSDSSALDADGNSAWNINQTCATTPCPVCEKRKKCTACQSVYQAENSGTINLIPNMGSSQTTFEVQQSDTYIIIWKVVSHDSSCTACNTDYEFSANTNNICWKDNTTAGNFAPEQITIPATPQNITLTRLDPGNAKCRPNCGVCEVKYFSGPIVSSAGIVTSGGCGDTSQWNQVGNLINGGSAIYLTTQTTPPLARRTLPT
jgi:hypothetical protein